MKTQVEEVPEQDAEEEPVEEEKSKKKKKVQQQPEELDGETKKRSVDGESSPSEEAMCISIFVRGFVKYISFTSP